MLSAQRRAGGLARLSHLPVSENDKAGKVRKKRKNDIIYSRLGENGAAKQSRSTIIHQSFRLSVRKEGGSVVEYRHFKCSIHAELIALFGYVCCGRHFATSNGPKTR